ncbi:MAG: glutamine-hydrolyzing carbamoyl-phosphate synthase small subunit [Nitrospirae bacterium]|nr:glutamine-hydrolyzing carbamoyl-phosphate synthase small subunit [Nitrospirota bacterium]
MKAVIALEDGRIFTGRAFGATGERTGEVVFNTSMTGYQEILTDPSYCGQIVTMTYPLIGNYGVNEEDFESGKPQVEGFIVKECSRVFSNYRAQKSLDEFLKENNILGVEGLDTRALTRHIRCAGAMKGIVSTEDLDEESLIEKAQNSPGLVGRDLVKEVTCEKVYDWNNKGKYKVLVIDCGVKRNILRELAKTDCRVTVAPASIKPEEILKMAPHGLLLSNGPGDPEGVPYLTETVKKIISAQLPMPVMGICLGHQILGLALGGKTYKLKFGHRGGNQPVKDLATGKVSITSQNHGFSVDIKSLQDKNVEVTHVNLNDQTIEGIRHKKHPLFSIQYHPEASPGPHDAKYLFHEFVEIMKRSIKY